MIVIKLKTSNGTPAYVAGIKEDGKVKLVVDVVRAIRFLSAHLATIYRIDNSLSLEHYELWSLCEPAPEPEYTREYLHQPHRNVTLNKNTLADDLKYINDTHQKAMNKHIEKIKEAVDKELINCLKDEKSKSEQIKADVEQALIDSIRSVELVPITKSYIDKIDELLSQASPYLLEQIQYTNINVLFEVKKELKRRAEVELSWLLPHISPNDVESLLAMSDLDRGVLIRMQLKNTEA